MSGGTAYRPRRSVLYMPGNNERALEKAKTLPVDGLILDLEDAVGPTTRPRPARTPVPQRHPEPTDPREVTIRVNGSGTQWHDDDLAAACAAGPDGIVVPKVDSADEVRSLVEAMERHGAPERTRLWAMVETPEAVLAVGEIASAAPRLAVLVMGTNDLVKELGARHVPGRAPLLTALSLSAPRGPALGGRDPRRRVQRRDGRSTASRPSAARAATWGSTARPSSIRARSTRATGCSRRRRTRWPTPASCSPRGMPGRVPES